MFQASLPPLYPCLLRSTRAPFFPEPYLPGEVKPKRPSENPDAKTPCAPTPQESASSIGTQPTPNATSTSQPKLAKPTTNTTTAKVDTPTSSMEVRGSLVPRRLTGRLPDSGPLTPPSTPPPAPPDEEPATLLPGGRLVTRETECVATPPSPPAATPPPTEAQEEAPRSFLESVDEIPFADDEDEDEEEEVVDSRGKVTLRPRDKAFFTPPPSDGLRDPPSGERTRGAAGAGAGARGVAEERMRAWGNSVKSQALRDAVEQQLRKMKEAEAADAAKPPSEDSGKRETRRRAALLPPERAVPAREGGRGPGASAPPTNTERKARAEPEESPPKHGSVWKAVFQRKDTRKEDRSQRGLASAEETTDLTNDSSLLGQSSGELRCDAPTVCERV